MRPLKIHYAPPSEIDRPYAALCGQGSGTSDLARVTCRVCMFRYLAQQAPWAEKFLRDLKAATPEGAAA